MIMPYRLAGGRQHGYVVPSWRAGASTVTGHLPIVGALQALPDLCHHKRRPTTYVVTQKLASPGVDVGALLGGAAGWRRRSVEQGDEVAARLGGVDDVVDLEVRGDADALADFVGLGDEFLEQLPALLLVGRGIQLAAIAERTAPSKPIPPNSLVGQAKQPSGAFVDPPIIAWAPSP